MKNVNINLTTEQAKLVEKTTRQYGFANRSEFFRAVLRYIFFYSPEVLRKLDTAMFEEPPTRNAGEIIAELGKTGKYNKKFIESIAKGLRESEYFKS